MMVDIEVRQICGLPLSGRFNKYFDPAFVIDEVCSLKCKNAMDRKEAKVGLVGQKSFGW